MTPKQLQRLIMPIPLLIDGIRVARGVTGGHNTDEIDRDLIAITKACDTLITKLFVEKPK